MSLNIASGKNTHLTLSSNSREGHGKYSVLGEDGPNPKDSVLPPRNLVEEELQKDKKSKKAPSLALFLENHHKDQIVERGDSFRSLESIEDDQSAITFFKQQQELERKAKKEEEQRLVEELRALRKRKEEEEEGEQRRELEEEKIQQQETLQEQEEETNISVLSDEKKDGESEVADDSPAEPKTPEQEEQPQNLTKQRDLPCNETDQYTQPVLGSSAPLIVPKSTNDDDDANDEERTKAEVKKYMKYFTVILWLLVMTNITATMSAIKLHSFFPMDLFSGLALMLLACPPLIIGKEIPISTWCSSWFLFLNGIKIFFGAVNVHPDEKEKSVAPALHRRRHHSHLEPTITMNQLAMWEVAGFSLMWLLLMTTPHLLGVFTTPATQRKGGAEVFGVLVCVAALFFQWLAFTSLIEQQGSEADSASIIRSELGLNERQLLDLGEVFCWLGIFILSLSNVKGRWLAAATAAALGLAWTLAMKNQFGTLEPGWLSTLHVASQAVFLRYDVFRENRTHAFEISSDVPV